MSVPEVAKRLSARNLVLESENRRLSHQLDQARRVARVLQEQRNAARVEARSLRSSRGQNGTSA